MKFKEGQEVYHCIRGWHDQPRKCKVLKTSPKQMKIKDIAEESYEKGYEFTRTLTGDQLSLVFATKDEAWEHLAQRQENLAEDYEERAREMRNNATEYRSKIGQP